MLLAAQSCLTLWDPTDCSLPGSPVHGISQARVLEWLAIPFSRGSSQSRDRTQLSCMAGRFFTIWASKDEEQSEPRRATQARRLQHKVGVNCCLLASWKEVSFYGIIQISFQSFNSILLEEAEAYFCPIWVLTSFQEFAELQVGFPRSSVGKEYACNAGDLGLIPGSGRSPGEGTGNPLQYSCLEHPHGQRSLAGYSP